ncbi:MAG: glycosyltransferase, partial [Bacteroidales bacterium]|nr:glycosyltransferase [Bacteroidales bacterium]
LLIMSGSMGYGNLQQLVDNIITKCDVELFLVCGNNKRLKADLQKRYEENTNVIIIGFTDKLASLMDSCDVLFTKPGGLSSTEAAAKGIPIIHTAPIPGCETRNALFFHYHGMSYSTMDVAEQVARAEILCKDNHERGIMIRSQRANINPNTGKDILQLLKKIK